MIFNTANGAYRMQNTIKEMNAVTPLKDAPLANYPHLSDKVYEAIKNDILSGRVAPGVQLQVVELARQLGVSRTPVKEALSRLIMEGLVEGLPRKGFFVSIRDSENITELLDARLMLELVAVERGIKLSKPAEIEQMRLLLREIDETIDAQGRYVDYEDFVRKDAEFHFLIVGMARNRHLLSVYRHLFVHFHAARMHFALGSGYRRALETRQEHKVIVEAFESQDLAALKAAITEHMQESMKWFAAAQARVDGLARTSH